jgi:hypothetical protein
MRVFDANAKNESKAKERNTKNAKVFCDVSLFALSPDFAFRIPYCAGEKVSRQMKCSFLSI